VIALFAAAIVAGYFTPQAAALAPLRPQPGKTVTVQRVNLAGPYAAVLTSGVQWDDPVSVPPPVLVEHFSFGWQAVDFLESTCILEQHRLGAKIDAALNHGMSIPASRGKCTGVQTDTGPRSDVEAVRQLISGTNTVPYVRVAGDWAFLQWYHGPAAGTNLYHKVASGWTFVAGGGGAIDPATLHKLGVPQPDICAFGINDPKCPPQH
jgi:hypothetical protein